MHPHGRTRGRPARRLKITSQSTSISVSHTAVRLHPVRGRQTPGQRPAVARPSIAKVPLTVLFFNVKAHDLPFGQGKSNIAGVLAQYHAQGYPGPLHCEYEYNWETSVPEITQCLEFVKNWKPAK